jgi:hypothetical protein
MSLVDFELITFRPRSYLLILNLYELMKKILQTKVINLLPLHKSFPFLSPTSLLKKGDLVATSHPAATPLAPPASQAREVGGGAESSSGALSSL